LAKGIVVIVAACEHAWKKNGFDKNGNPRKRCKLCGTSYVDRQFTALGEMRIDLDQAAQAIGLLCEGMSVRAVCRITGLNKQTVLRLVVRAGRGIAEYSERTIRGLAVAEVECDELWGYTYCKRATQKIRDFGSHVGDLYSYLAIDRNTKLILASAYGKRDTETAVYFMQRLKVAAPVIGQLSTDGWQSFPGIVSLLWGEQINYGQIVKIVATKQDGKSAARRYSCGEIKEIRRKAIIGEPNMRRISTSFSERFNLSVRMGNRRMTRLTNAFSKKRENHEAMMNLFIGIYNFCKVHGTLKTTPAVAAGLADRPWTIRELLEKTEPTH
jgi:transposase-like protein/IS1 family transposase